jgi:hypothetical protein
MPKSFAPEVIADASGKWSGNGLRFATREEAERWVRDLERQWMLVIDTRVVESNDPVNYAIVANQQVSRSCAISAKSGSIRFSRRSRVP